MERKNYISLMNVISCIAVVFLHTNSCFWTYSTERYWKTANLIECLCFFAVPCFFMISGATLINFRERYTLKEYFKKRLLRTLIPFIFWSLVGLLYCYKWRKTLGKDAINFKSIYNGVFGAQYVSIYWFFLTIFCIYLCIPLFAYVEKAKRKEVFTYLAIAAFVCNMFIPFFRYLYFDEWKWPLTINVASGYLLYVIVGYLLSEYEMDKKVRRLIYVASIAGFLIHLLGTYYASAEAGAIVQTYKGNGMPCMMYSVGIFVWVKYNGEKIMKSKAVRKVVDFLKEYTLGIFLVHWFLKDIMIRDIGIDERSIVFRLCAPFAIIVVSVTMLAVMKKIPVLKRVVG